MLFALGFFSGIVAVAVFFVVTGVIEEKLIDEDWYN